MSTIDIAAVRAEIPALSATTYLNTAGIGPSPRCVTDTIVRLYQQIATESPDLMALHEEEFTRAEATRETVARHWGVEADEVALLRSCAEGFNLVGHGIRWKAGDEIITCIQDHPAARTIWTVQAQRHGAVLKHMDLSPEQSGPDIVADIKRRITPRTRLISISHVTSENGLRVPAGEICRLAHEHGAEVFLDGTQAVGQERFDLHAIGVDYYAAGFYKWGLGPFGTGALYVRRDRLPTIDQVMVGAGGHKNFDQANATWTPDETARKFEFGARHWPLYPAMAAGIEFLEAVGLDAIRERSHALVARLRGGLKGAPGVIDFTPHDPALTTGFVAAAVDGMPGTDLRDRLRAEGYLLRANRGPNGIGGVRICCAFFNTEEEIERVAGAVRAIARQQAGVAAS